MKLELVRSGTCPSCGAPMTFGSNAALAQVCPHCRFVVARTDRDFRAIGRVADLMPIASPLVVGATGHIEGRPFRVAGRVQYDRASLESHQAPLASAPWQEFYLELDGGAHWAWLAHAQGNFYLMSRYDHPLRLPTPAEARPGVVIRLAGGEAFAITERAGRVSTSAEGELPVALSPGVVETYADMSGPSGAFGTLDYGDVREGARPPQVFFGRRIDPRGIAIDGGGASGTTAPRATLASVRCPGCGGDLPLATAEQTERVICRYCGTLSNLNAGVLLALRKVPPPEVAPRIELGAKGILRNQDVTVVGFMERGTTVEGSRYRWREYLLYSNGAPAGSDSPAGTNGPGFLFLLEENGSWEFIVPIGAGDVERPADRLRVYGGKTFRWSAEVRAEVESVVGEFYWKVEVGESVVATEYQGPQRAKLSEESTGSEITVSYSTPLVANELTRAFGDKFRRASALATPSAGGTHHLYWLGLLGAWLAVTVLSCARAEEKVVYQGDVPVKTAAKATAPAPTPRTTVPTSPTGSVTADEADSAFFTEPFDVPFDGKNMKVVFSAANLQNNWIAADVALVNDAAGIVLEDSIELSYYSGTEGGESWSEGSRDHALWYSHVPSGKYVLRIDPAVDPKTPAPGPLHVTATSDRPPTGYMVFAFFALVFLYVVTTFSRRARLLAESRKRALTGQGAT